ncbi:MAG: FliI/YscN family ATPase [Deltaproteobacteria bacterium]|nr:FliI/YscN family ATPase [Deltaproteobacteria bacterium]
MRLELLKTAIDDAEPVRVHGKVTRVIGMVIEGVGVGISIGEMCRVFPLDGAAVVCEVVGFNDDRVLLMPLGDTRGLGPGSKIVRLGAKARVRLGAGLLGRVIDGLGNPIDGKGLVQRDSESSLYKSPQNPLTRKRIAEPLDVGIKAVNSLLTVGCGQRVGIFAGSGVGKSVLMGMMARNTEADVNVIALIGERGREVKEFIEKDLKAEGLKRSVVIVVTSDQPPLLRVRGAFLAMTIAEYFRDEGRQVLLLMDSLTRFAMAQREIGLAVGEPPTTKGYPPSVFALLPRLLERVGTTDGDGAITGFFTVLVEGDDMSDIVADTARAILDGHVVLSREMASMGHYPAIDVLMSISRCMMDIVSPEHWDSAQRVKSVLAVYRHNADLINIGAYKEGTNPEIDHAVKAIGRVERLLRQGMDEKVDYDDSLQQMYGLNLQKR